MRGGHRRQIAQTLPHRNPSRLASVLLIQYTGVFPGRCGMAIAGRIVALGVAIAALAGCAHRPERVQIAAPPPAFSALIPPLLAETRVPSVAVAPHRRRPHRLGGRVGRAAGWKPGDARHPLQHRFADQADLGGDGAAGGFAGPAEPRRPDGAFLGRSRRRRRSAPPPADRASCAHPPHRLPQLA